MVYTLRFFFSSKCSLFHNSNILGSCIIHILYTGCAKIKKKNSGANRLKIRFVPRSKHSDSVIETSTLIQCREVIGVCSEIHTKHNNIVWWQNVEFLVSSAECRKVTISCPLLRIKQLGSQLNRFSLNLIFGYFSKTCR